MSSSPVDSPAFTSPTQYHLRSTDAPRQRHNTLQSPPPPRNVSFSQKTRSFSSEPPTSINRFESNWHPAPTNSAAFTTTDPAQNHQIEEVVDRDPRDFEDTNISLLDPSLWGSRQSSELSSFAVPWASAPSAAVASSGAKNDLGHTRRPSTPKLSNRKRAATVPHRDEGFVPEPSTKRQRLEPKTEYHLSSFAIDPAYAEQPTSPLFFSNSPRPRPSLPPRFSSSEAAAKMLSKARGEDHHIKTVSLARGHVSTPQISQVPTSAPQYQSARSIERSTTGRSSSPESNIDGRELSPILHSIGIIELLEQDERPTFIVDLADSSNYGTGALHLLFSNSSLRSQDGLEALVSGTSADEMPSSTAFHLQFKSWLLSAAVNGESLNVCLPSFLFANITWSCSTLRKRFRIIAGTVATTTVAQRSTAPFRLSNPPTRGHDTQSLDSALSASVLALEPADYFGPSTKGEDFNMASDLSSTRSEIVPTIEPTHSAGREPGSSGGSSAERDQTSTLPLTPGYLTQTTTTHAQQPSTSTPSELGLGTYPSTAIIPDIPSFDWTRLPITDSMPEHIRFARSIDWANTPLGPIETWGPDLRQMCNLIMASPHPAAMYWGDEHVIIYNEAYILLAGQKHPKLMGAPYGIAWSEIWNEIEPVFANAKITGEATMKDDDCLFIKRSEYLEETYFSWSIIPLVGRDGTVMGLYNPAFEKTRRKIAERRMLTLRELGERTSSARDVKSFWAQVLGSFEFNEYDSPFLMLYSVSDETDSDASSIHSNSVFASRQCILEGSLGVPDGHPASPPQIDLRSGTEGFGPVFREIIKTDKPVLLEVGSRDLPESLVDGLEWRGFGDPVRAVVACPIHPTTGESILGFLVLGVNPRRPYDDDYSLFVQLLSRQLATSLASVVLFEEEIRRGQKAAKLAALDRIELSEQLAARTQEAIDSETKFTRMAEFAPVGIFIADSAGRITFANDTWYDISRVPKNKSMADTWMESVKPGDYELVKQLWKDLVIGGKFVSSEFRFKAQWEDRSGNTSDTWVLFSGYPEKHTDGRLKSVFGSITNISQQKWAEGIQTRKMEEAVELKRQQENFIDITSHEMRNPLSAILQCSDEISSCLTSFKQSKEKVIPDEVVTSCLDAAQIISLCSQHQKRIVDDVLTLSKLDSQLLLVTPVDAQPLTVAQRALKMHEGELQAADIQLKFVVDKSYRDMGLDWVRLDPSRVMQVLINLTTNAIKFTGTESKRIITVTISATTTRPSDMPNTHVKYFPTRNKRHDIMQQKEWGSGDLVYVLFSVEDTGRGLNPEEKKLLFMRFSQASPRTHVQYGGSGLGLFISRELTELQGGEIGVESEAGKGSTFAFYIMARRISPPETTDAPAGIRRSTSMSQELKPRLYTAQLEKAANQRLEGSSAQALSKIDVSSPLKRTALRVLIVEDNLVNQRVLQKQLKNMGTEVHLANHGGEALEKLRNSTYWASEDDTTADRSKRLELGVVLMDQEMPVMDGLTCTRRIRELEKEGRLTGHVPIIAVTANARAEQVQTALDAGMDHVISKPFRIVELLPKIEELLIKFPAPRLDS